MRLVDADAVIEKLKQEFWNVVEIDSLLANGVSLARRIVEAEQIVDAKPVKHGKWVAIPSSDMVTGKAYECSECKKMRFGSFKPNYCQNCGAKMRGGNDE